MKNNKLLLKLITLILALTVIMVIGAVSAFAVGEDEVVGDNGAQQQQQQEQQQEQQQQEQPQAVDPQQTPAQDEPAVQPDAEQPQVVETQEQAETSAPAREPMYEYIYGYSEDATSAYEAPQHLGDLPQVTSSEVVEATAVAIPDVAVSDATMFSGIVMWLCVALGIAVIVGVLVSKRTRRRGV